MATSLDIINIALARLGESPIQSLDEGTVPANLAKIFYDSSRKTALRAHPWVFALRRERLVRVDEVPGDFRFTYALPQSCLRALRIGGSQVPDGSNRGERFTVRGAFLLTDAETAVLEYVADIEEADEFDDKFVEALSYKLASELAVSLKGSVELMANYANLYEVQTRQAASVSLGEEDAAPSDNPYMEARLYGNC